VVSRVAMVAHVRPPPSKPGSECRVSDIRSGGVVVGDLVHDGVRYFLIRQSPSMRTGG
jgi:hypothetical protein